MNLATNPPHLPLGDRSVKSHRLINMLLARLREAVHEVSPPLEHTPLPYPLHLITLPPPLLSHPLINKDLSGCQVVAAMMQSSKIMNPCGLSMQALLATSNEVRCNGTTTTSNTTATATTTSNTTAAATGATTATAATADGNGNGGDGDGDGNSGGNNGDGDDDSDKTKVVVSSQEGAIWVLEHAHFWHLRDRCSLPLVAGNTITLFLNLLLLTHPFDLPPTHPFDLPSPTHPLICHHCHDSNSRRNPQ